MTPHPARTRVGAVLSLAFAVGLALALPAGVAADAELVSSAPADGATTQGSPAEIIAVFSEPLRADGSGITLRDAAGTTVATGQLDPADPSRLIIADVPDLAPGEYEARWTAASDDGHLVRGTWAFTVELAPTATPAPTTAPTASPSSSPSPTGVPSSSPSAAPSPSPSPAPSGDGDEPAAGTADVLIPIIAGLAVVVIAAGLLMGRRDRTSPPA
ncbi:MAG: copper resistance CopC family protein [Chloroflexota bacterium]